MSKNQQSSLVGYEQIQAAAAAVRAAFGLDTFGIQNNQAADVATVAVVLGSGLGHIADTMIEQGGKYIDYHSIPHFPVSSVEGHKGRLVLGTVTDASTASTENAGKPKRVLLMQGRVHRYEGYSAQEVVFPVRVLLALGVKTLILTNAAGGLGDGMQAGDLMLLTDHLNLTADNPLIGHNDNRLGVRFPDMSETYTPALRELALQIASSQGLPLQQGVYAGLLGPSYETPAEIRMLKTMGAHAVGMSTVLEAIAARHGGAKIIGISCITNLAAGISKTLLNHDEVKEIADRSAGAFAKLVVGIVERV